MSIATLVSKKLYPRINRRRTILFIFALALCLAGIAAHIHLRNSSQDYTGPLALLDRVFDLSLVLGLSIVMLALGRAVCRRFRLDFTSTAEDLSFSLFLGTGVAGLSVLCLGLVGLLRAWPIAMLFAAFLLLTRAELPQLFEVILAGIQRAVSTAEGRLLTLLFVCLATILLLRAATPPHAYDEAIYHLAATRQFVEQGRVFPSYDNSMGNQPFLVHMIYAVCLIAKSDIAAKLLSLLLGISTALALYGFCSRFLTRRVGVIALFAFFAAGMVVEVAVTARIDVSLAGMLFLATYSMINYLETERHGWLCVSALFAGFSLGIKHSAGMWLLFVGAMYIVERLIRRREHFATVLRRGFGYMCIAAAIASPWYVKNYVWFHNPLYPFLIGEVADFGPQGVRYFNIDDERKLDAHFDLVRRELPEVVKAQESVVKHAVDLRLQRHAMRPWEFFIRPNTYLVADFRHYPNYLFLVIPLLFFLRRPKWIVWLLVMSTGFFLFVTWTSWIARYLLPFYPPLTIVAAYTLAAFCDRLGLSVAFARRLSVYALAVGLSTVMAACVLSLRDMKSLGFITGTISRRQFMLAIPYYRPIDFINRQLPANARIMIFDTQMNYDLHRDYISDETWFATKWRRLLIHRGSLEDVNEELKRQGFTHVLFSPDLFTYAAIIGVEGSGMDFNSGKRVPLSEEARRLGPEYPLLRNWATFTLYRTKFLEPIYTDENDYEVLRIK